MTKKHRLSFQEGKILNKEISDYIHQYLVQKTIQLNDIDTFDSVLNSICSVTAHFLHHVVQGEYRRKNILESIDKLKNQIIKLIDQYEQMNGRTTSEKIQ